MLIIVATNRLLKYAGRMRVERTNPKGLYTHRGDVIRLRLLTLPLHDLLRASPRDPDGGTPPVAH